MYIYSENETPDLGPGHLKLQIFLQKNPCFSMQQI